MLKLFEILALGAAIVFAAAMIGMLVLYSSPAADDSKGERHATQSTHKNEAREVKKSFWQRTTEDPVAFFTLWLAIFTAVLGFVAMIQLKFLLRAEEISARSMSAAQLSAEIAERALVAGQRAFVSVTFENAGVIEASTGKITHWNITPIWTNAGDTPTRNMTNHVSMLAFAEAIPADWKFPDIWDSKTPIKDRVNVPLGISPKNLVRGQTVTITVDELEAVIAKQKFLYVWGWASYNDVFPETVKHVTRFAVHVTVGGKPREKDRVSFAFNYLPRYNCSDEECAHQKYPANWEAPQLVRE